VPGRQPRVTDRPRPPRFPGSGKGLYSQTVRQPHKSENWCRKWPRVRIPLSRWKRESTAPQSTRSVPPCARCTGVSGNSSGDTRRAAPNSRRGQILLPWPNRIDHGRYSFWRDHLPTGDHRTGTRQRDPWADQHTPVAAEPDHRGLGPFHPRVRRRARLPLPHGVLGVLQPRPRPRAARPHRGAEHGGRPGTLRPRQPQLPHFGDSRSTRSPCSFPPRNGSPSTSG